MTDELKRQMLDALRDAEYALSGIALTFTYEDGDDAEAPCPFVELCGEYICHECGCIRDKRADVREAITAAELQP